MAALPPDVCIGIVARTTSAIIVAWMLGGCDRGQPAEYSLVGELASHPDGVRTFEARTSVPVRYAGCVMPEDLQQSARCPIARPPGAETQKIAVRAATLVRDSLSPDALHASALIDLHWGDSSGKSLDRSIQSLGQSARFEQSAVAWADLAAAELVHADREGEPRDRLAALEAAARAISIDSMNLVAQFNLALAAERLGLDGRARKEWMRFIALESEPQWIGEARARVAAIDRRAVPSARGALDSSQIETLAERDPNALRLRMMTEELGLWSDSVSSPDSAQAALARIRVAAMSLASRYADSALFAVLSELSDVKRAAAVKAAAHDLSNGFLASRAGRYADAESLFARARGVAGSPNLQAWGRSFEAGQQVFTGKTELAIKGLGAAVAAAKAGRRDVLEERAGWTLAVMLFRAGRGAEAGPLLDRVAAVSMRLGDREGVAAVTEFRAEDRYVGGDERAAWRLLLESLSVLRGFHASLRLRSGLSMMAYAAEERGLNGAAAVVRSEDAAVALASGHPEFHADALVSAARLQLMQGDTVGALAAIRELESSSAPLPQSDVSTWRAARVAQLRIEAGQRVGRPQLDSAVEFFARQQSGVQLGDALLVRARALSSSDAPRAERDLDSALVLLAQRANQYRSSAERRALEGRIKAIASRLALVHIEQGDTAAGLAAVERGRGGPSTPAVVPGTVVLDFLLAGDTLVSWCLGAGPMTMTRQVVSSRRIAFARERIVRGAETGRMDRSSLVTLFDILIRPHLQALRGTERITIVADDELAGIPFAALRDTTGAGAYLVESASVRVAPSLRAAQEVRQLPRGSVHALLVGDPAFDSKAFSGLGSLPGARAEVQAIGARYSLPIVLTGASATKTRVVSSMADVGVVHFASHAQFDAERPELSHLLLARDAGGNSGLSARAISQMQLSHLELVVLSSCESSRSGVADAPLTVGLAKAFHDAGVRAVVGALWRVDDAATSALMTGFHIEFSRTRDAAQALQAAQLALLHGPTTSRRDPAAWAAFVYTER